MNEKNDQKYIDLGYSHEEIEFLLNKIKNGSVLTPAQHNKLVDDIGIENISTFDGNYDNLLNRPDIPQIVKDVARELDLVSNVTVGDALEVLSQEIKNNMKSISTLNKQKADVAHTHEAGDITGIQELINGKADMEHYHDADSIMGLGELVSDAVAGKADRNHTHNDIYTKSEIDDLINDIITGGEIDLSGYVTEEQLENYATKESVKDFITLKNLADQLVAYVTIEELASRLEEIPLKDHTHNVSDIEDIQDELDKKANLDEVYNKEQVNDLLENISAGEIVLPENLLTKDEADNTYSKIEDMEAIIELVDLLENSIEEVDGSIATVQSNLEKKMNTNKQDLEIELNSLKAEVEYGLNNKADKNHTHDIYYSKSEIDNKLAQLNSGGSIDLEGYLKQEDLLPVQENVDALSEEIKNKADKEHTHEYSIADIEGLQEALDNKANTDDAVEIPEDIMDIINNKADKEHKHDYASSEHTHNLKIENIENLQAALDEKANVDDMLSEEDIVNLIKDNVGDIGPSVDPEHTHEEYAPKDHSHDNYAEKEHTHDYAPTEHGHDNYAEKEHTHSDYAKNKHNHDDNYAPLVHTHDYSPTTHNHDDEYAPYKHNHKIENITNLQATLDKKLESGMVYTKEEVDRKLVDISTGGTVDLEGFIKQSDLARGLATKADVVHTHMIDEIDDLQRMLDKKGNAADMATKAELNQGLAVKADTTHTHTLDEVDELQGTIDNMQIELNKKADAADAVTKKELTDGLAKKSNSDHTHEYYAPKDHGHENYYSKLETEEVVDNLFESKASILLTTANIYTDTAIAEIKKDAPLELDSFADVANRLTQQDATIESVRKDISGALGNVAPADHTHSEYATVEDEIERDTFTTTELTVSTLGGIAAGSDLNGLTVKEILNKLLYPYVAPTISVSGTPNGGLFEKGNKQTITSVRVVVTKKSEKITKIEVLQGNTVLVVQEDSAITNGGTFNYEVNVPVNSTNVQLTGRVTDATGTTRTGTTTAFNFVYPYYVGVCGENDTIDEALVKGLEKRIEAKGTKSISYTTNQQRMIIAYPKAHGVIRKILDPNSFDVTDTFTRTEIRITGLDGTSQSYYVYVNNASTVSGFTMTFSY